VLKIGVHADFEQSIVEAASMPPKAKGVLDG